MDFNTQHAISIKRGQPGKFWDLETGKALLRLSHANGSISAVIFDDKYIATGFSDGCIRLWSISEKEWVRELLGHEQEIGTLFLGHGMLASGSEDHTIKVGRYN
jgi:WD40 repeat protein